MTAESKRIKALAGLLTNEDLYNDDLFFSGSVRQKQQLIVEKLSKSTPIKKPPPSSHVVVSSSSSSSSMCRTMEGVDVAQQQHAVSHNNNNSYNNDDDTSDNINENNDEEVRFGKSANQATFTSASVRERAAAMSGFLTKKNSGPTSGQARAMEWRSGGSGSNTGSAGVEYTPKKIASDFVSQFDRVDGMMMENDVNDSSSNNNNAKRMMKKKSKPSFLLQFDDSPRADSIIAGNNFADYEKEKEEEEVPIRAPLTPRTPRTPLTPRTPSSRSIGNGNNNSSSNNSNSNSNNSNSVLPSPRTQTTTTPRGSRHHSNRMLTSPRRASSNKTSCNFANFDNNDNDTTTAIMNSSMAVEAGSIVEEIDNWLVGGMSLSDTDDEETKNEQEDEEVDNDSNNGEDDFFMNDLDKVLSEANGFLVGVVDSDDDEEEVVEVVEEVEEEEEEERVHFDFNNDDDEEEEETEGMSDDLESELESARQLAQDFTRFLHLDDGFMSPVAAGRRSGGGGEKDVENIAIQEEVEEGDDFGWVGGASKVEDEVVEDEVVEEEIKPEIDAVEVIEEEEVMNDMVVEEVHVLVDDEEESVLSEYVEDEVAQEEVEDDNADDGEGDWEGWTRNNDFFTDFTEDYAADDASEIAEPVAAARKEVIPTQIEPAKSLPQKVSYKPKLRIQIKGAPELKTDKEEEEEAFFYASHPSPQARDDEQLLDTQLVPSPVAEEPPTSKVDTSPKKNKATPKKFGLKKIVHRVRPDIDEESVTSKTHTSPKRTYTSPKKLGLKKIAQRASIESDDESVENMSLFGEGISSFNAFDTSVSLTKSDESERKIIQSPPKLTIYIKGAPQFVPSTQIEEEDAFYFAQPSPLVGDDKGLLSFNFPSSPTAFEPKKENTLTSSTKKHLKKFVNKRYHSRGNTKAEEDYAFGDQVGNDGFNNDFFGAPASPVRQAKDAMKDGGSTKKKILGLLSGKKKKQSRGLYLLDD